MTKPDYIDNVVLAPKDVPLPSITIKPKGQSSVVQVKDITDSFAAFLERHFGHSITILPITRYISPHAIPTQGEDFQIYSTNGGFAYDVTRLPDGNVLIYNWVPYSEKGYLANYYQKLVD